MQLFSGSPLALKKRFIETVKTLKQNPFDRVLVLIPSKHLENRLKTELCQDLSCLAGVSFMPLGALAREINQTAETPPPPLAEATPLLDFKIRHLLKKHGFSNSRNLAICFKNSFRDLINAEVEPETLLAVQDDDEELVIEEQKTYLKKFVPLYEDFLEMQKVPGKSTYKDFFIAARENAANNTFLNSFKQIIFYGFYDLTSLHYELIKAVIKNYDNTQVYFPFEKENPAYNFVDLFFKNLFLPLAAKDTGHTPLPSENNLIKVAAENIFKPSKKSARGANINMIKVSGEGEVQAAAKEILKLHKNGIPYKDIALTFRTEANFSKRILEVFKENKIPLNCNFAFPLLEKPFAAFVYNLFNLEQSNFAREEVAAVINAPFFTLKQENWVDLIQQSGVECSINQFEEMISDKPPQAKQTLIDTLKELKAHIAALKQAGSFDTLAQRAKDYILKYTSEQAQKEQADILAQITEILDNITAYSTTGKTADEGEFLEEFFALLKDASFNYVLSAPNAVEAADIMTLRLQDFKAVIILGLNGGILPLVPQPDPALKEVYRQSLKKPLRKTLQNIGYLIHTTQNRYLEENLLFYLALSAAQEKAILTYKTTTAQGETMVKSIFITLLLSVLGQNEDDIKTFSRRPIERLKKDIEPQFLTQTEAASLTALTKPSSRELFCNLLGEQTEDAYHSLRAFSAQDSLNAFDGIIGKEAAKKIYPQKFSPSSLERLYNCPLKYFFSRIIKEPPEISLRGTLAPNQKGNIYHDILHKFYTYILNKHNFAQITWPDMENLFKTFVEDEFKKPEYKKYGLYPLFLESIKQELKENLLIFLEHDLTDIQKTGFCPCEFEKSKAGSLKIKGKNLNIEARIDRIDQKPNSAEKRAVDYKSKYTEKYRSDRKNLNAFAPIIYKSGTLQPPLYLAIPESKQDEVFTSAALLFIENTPQKLKELTLDEFNKIWQDFEMMLSFLHELTLEGTFPLRQNDNCQNCAFKDICRRHHLQSVKRAQKSEYLKQLRKYHDFKG